MPIWNEEVPADRRRARRIRLTESVQYQLTDSADFGGSRAVDISETGVQILLNDFIPLQSQLKLRVELTKGNVVDCMGRVVWVTKLPLGENYQAGLEFTNNQTIFWTKCDIRDFIDIKVM